ncbi:tRNA (adenosine(37)-N6)-dimethylallyltransferase MiaA [Lacisediminihabitans changchengi]|uniref:tRNA dimethylallyltransferase n=1 Tax=Lacisediminihabitans changchengi TaxID=2787634 RepID=A0A934W4L6_9MICO|nr:tRNA (adenosine(37)-N6)-dimethylallyltransferase MiaA [Lacisediminihabitans changchengi]MBK4347610.1 tRNA (adenosine(37)-N6)-dimethylallyltransferase MiaA [Lacisediminihabitans changchengi]
MGSANPEPAQAGAEPLVVIVGATGTGKSALSLDLAERLAAQGRPAEIVNADAMQLYRGMDIGTAKLPVTERRGIPHHLLDVLDPREEASVASFQEDARAAIDAVRSRGALPILVGGSGLYVSAVVWDFRFPGTDPEIRARLEAELLAVGPGLLFQRLRHADPAAAAAIGPHNGRRIVRALEVGEITGEPFGSGLPDESRLWSPTRLIGLRTQRIELIPRLDARVEGMWRDGILDEARALIEHGVGVTSGRAIGYAQAIAQLRGELAEADAIEQSQALTRKYARRQVSWFTRYPATWLEADDPQRVERAIEPIDS